MMMKDRENKSMYDFLRALRLGVVNIFGVAIPGFLILFFFIVGFTIPIFAVFPAITDFFDIPKISWNPILDFFGSNKFGLSILIIILSYVAGYIIRMTSPDHLDHISEQAGATTKNRKSFVCGVYTEDDLKHYSKDGIDHFPYLRFGEYLIKRGHKELLEFVPWGAIKEYQNMELAGNQIPSNEWKPIIAPSKTCINKLKLEISVKHPELSAVIESHEAHIRLMSGTWFAINATHPFVMASTGICLIFIFLLFSHYFNNIDKQNYQFLPFFVAINVSLLFFMFWAERNITYYFHYRRVSELFFIVQSAAIAKKQVTIE